MHSRVQAPYLYAFASEPESGRTAATKRRASALLRPNAGLSHDTGPLRDLGPDLRAKFSRVRTDGLEAYRGELLANVGSAQGFDEFGIELRDDRLRRAAGREYPVPNSDF